MPSLLTEAIRPGAAGANGLTPERGGLGRAQVHERSQGITLQPLDRALISELQQRYQERGPFPRTSFGMQFRNDTLARLAKPSDKYTPTDVEIIGDVLALNGALTLHTNNGHSVPVAGVAEPLPVVTISATEAKTGGDMEERWWARDQAQAVLSVFSELKYFPDKESEKYRQQLEVAQSVLLGTLHPLSTPTQIEDRFNGIIREPDLAKNYLNWPQTIIDKDKLDSVQPTNWRQHQDGLQMVGIATLDAIDDGFLSVNDPETAHLEAGNKQFLGSIMPFLVSVNFTEAKNVGSWEEVDPEGRTSVVGTESALLEKILLHANEPGFEFLREGFDNAKGHLLRNKDKTSFKGTDFNENTSFEDALGMMIQKGLTKVGDQIPHEAPNPKDPILYTGADAAELYLLQYGVPQLLEKYKIPIKRAGGKPLKAKEIEIMLLEEVGKLYDPVTNGIFRYGAPDDPNIDSYLGPNYNTFTIQEKIDFTKKMLAQKANGGAINLGQKREERAKIVPKGRQAAWLHFNPQINAWASKRYMETGDQWYLDIAGVTFNYWLSMVTGKGEYHSRKNGDGRFHVLPVEEFRLPECYPTMIAEDGTEIIIPSPNVPLNWGVGKSRESIAVYKAALKKKQSDFVPAA